MFGVGESITIAIITIVIVLLLLLMVRSVVCLLLMCPVLLLLLLIIIRRRRRRVARLETAYTPSSEPTRRPTAGFPPCHCRAALAEISPSFCQDLVLYAVQR